MQNNIIERKSTSKLKICIKKNTYNNPTVKTLAAADDGRVLTHAHIDTTVARMHTSMHAQTSNAALFAVSIYKTWLCQRVVYL